METSPGEGVLHDTLFRLDAATTVQAKIQNNSLASGCVPALRISVGVAGSRWEDTALGLFCLSAIFSQHTTSCDTAVTRGGSSLEGRCHTDLHFRKNQEFDGLQPLGAV